MMENGFEYAGFEVAFPAPALRSSAQQTIELYQVEGYDSLGDRYVYSKGDLARVPMTIEVRVSGAVLASIEDLFFNRIRGTKETFTWWDRGAAHTVRLVTPDLSRQQTHPDRYLVKIQVEERVELPEPPDPLIGMPPDCLDPWEYVLSRKVLAPVWIVKMLFGGQPYWISDYAFAVPGWMPDVTLPWVGSWGEVRDSITGDLNEFKISDFSISLVNDPSAVPGIVELAENYDLEESPVEIYLWARGLDPAVLPPRLMFVGYVDEVEIPDDSTVELTLRDEAQRLRNYVGTKVSVDLYPDADPDDIGRVVPIVFGTVEQLEALAIDAGLMTSLAAGITNAGTSVTVSKSAGLDVGMHIWCDQEKMTISGIAGDTLTVVRGVSGTEPVAHDKAAVVWQDKAEFLYLVADHPVSAVSKVFGKVGQALVDITSICTLYTGAVGDSHASFPGKAVVSVPGYVTAAQSVALIPDLSGLNISLNGATVASLIALLDPGHTHSTISNTLTENPTSAIPTMTPAAISGWYTTPIFGIVGNPNVWYAIIDWPAHGNRMSVSYSLTFMPRLTRNGFPLYVAVDGVVYVSYVLNVVDGSPFSFTFTVPGNVVKDRIYVLSNSAGSDWWQITAASRTINLSNASSSNATGSSINPIEGSIGYADKAGSIALSGNSVANTLVADHVLVDVTGYDPEPGAVFSTFLSNHCSDNTFEQVGTFPPYYQLHGAITEYKQAIYWLDSWAFQLRSFFRRSRGVSKLIFRPTVPGAPVSIPAVRVDGGLREYPRRKGPAEEIINKINILFDRDWTRSGAEAYRGSSLGVDDNSVAVYGEKERPELFQFDFVTSKEMADDVRNFYLGRYARRYWIHEVTGYLGHVLRDFPDDVALDFHTGAVGEVRGVGLAPGSKSAIDKVKLVVYVFDLGAYMLDATAVDNFTITKGRTFAREWIFETGEGAPIDLTGVTVASQARRQRSTTAELVLDFDAEILETRDGGGMLLETKIRITAPDADIMAVDVATAFYDVKLTWPDAHTESAVEGFITFAEAVTV